MAEYFPDRRQLGRPLQNSPGLSGLNLRAANRQSGRYFSGSMNPREYSMMMRKQKGDSLAKAYGMTPEEFDSHMRNKISKATNFVSGGRKMGAGVSAAARNNIVGFKRAGVKPVRPNVDGLIKSISSNIVEDIKQQTESRAKLAKQTPRPQKKATPVLKKEPTAGGVQKSNNITNIQNVSQRVVSPGRGNFISNFNIRNRGDDESRRPLGMLGRFLDSIKDAISFAQFFGDKRNVQGIKRGLRALRRTFAEMLDTAIELRKVINKIFKTLRGANRLSGGGTSMRLGGGRSPNLSGGVAGRRRRAPRARVRPRGKMRGKLGLGLAGLGLLGGGLALGGQAKAADVAPPPPVEAPPPIPEDFSTTFGNAVDKFAQSIKKLFEKQEKGGKSSPGGGKSAPTSSNTPSTNSPSGGAMLGGAVSTNEEASLLKTIRQVEGTAGEDGYGKVFGGEVVPELARGEMTINEVIQMQNTGYMPERFGGRKVNYGTFFDKNAGKTRSSAASGAYQFMPDTLGGIADQTKVSRDALLTPELQDQLGLALVRRRGVDPKQKATLQTMETLGAEWAGLTPYYNQTTRTAADSLGIYEQFLKNPQVQPKMGPPAPELDPTRRQVMSQASKSISQVPPSQGPSSGQIATLPPMVMPTQGGSKTPTVIAPQGAKQEQAEPVPNLPSSDDNNFYTMYSRVVYNIIDA